MGKEKSKNRTDSGAMISNSSGSAVYKPVISKNKPLDKVKEPPAKKRSREKELR